MLLQSVFFLVSTFITSHDTVKCVICINNNCVTENNRSAIYHQTAILHKVVIKGSTKNNLLMVIKFTFLSGKLMKTSEAFK